MANMWSMMCMLLLRLRNVIVMAEKGISVLLAASEVRMEATQYEHKLK